MNNIEIILRLPIDCWGSPTLIDDTLVIGYFIGLAVTFYLARESYYGRNNLDASYQIAVFIFWVLIIGYLTLLICMLLLLTFVIPMSPFIIGEIISGNRKLKIKSTRV